MAQSYVAKRRAFASILNTALGCVVLIANIVLAIYPNEASEAPRVLESLWRTKDSVDNAAVQYIDPSVISARNALRKYALETSDSEAGKLEKEFEELAERDGKLTPEDQKREQQLLARYSKLKQRMGGRVPGARLATHSGHGNSGDAGAVGERMALAPSGSTRSGPSDLGTHATPASGAAAGVIEPATPGVQERSRESREQWLSDFRTVINPESLEPGERNIAIAIETFGPAAGTAPDQVFYAHLKVAGARLVTNLFRRDFVARGFFSELYGGDKELLRLAAGASRADLLILGRMNSVFRGGMPAEGDRVSCEITLRCKVIREDGKIIKMDRLRVAGPPLSASLALDRAAELLADLFCRRVVKPIL